MNSAYEHGGACFPRGGVQESGITDFSVNINPLGMPPAVREALHRAASTIRIPLRAASARRLPGAMRSARHRSFAETARRM